MMRCEQCENRIFYINHLEEINKEFIEAMVCEYKCHRNVGITDELYEWNRIAKTLLEKATGKTIEELIK